MLHVSCDHWKENLPLNLLSVAFSKTEPVLIGDVGGGLQDTLVFSLEKSVPEIFLLCLACLPVMELMCSLFFSPFWVGVLCLPLNSSPGSVLKLSKFIAHIFKLTFLNMPTKSVAAPQMHLFYIKLHITTCKYPSAFTENVQIVTQQILQRCSMKSWGIFLRQMFSNLKAMCDQQDLGVLSEM